MLADLHARSKLVEEPQPCHEGRGVEGVGVLAVTVDEQSRVSKIRWNLHTVCNGTLEDIGCKIESAKYRVNYLASSRVR